MSLRPAIPALLLLTGCSMADVAGMFEVPDPDSFRPDNAVDVEDAASGDDEPGRGGGLPATVALTVDVGSEDVAGIAYDIGTIEVELGELGWRPLTTENTGGTDEVEVEMEPVYLIADTITGFRMSFDAASAVVEGVNTPIVIAPIEAAGSWTTEEGTDYTITMMVDGGPLEEDLQGVRWDAELSIGSFEAMDSEDTGQ